MKKQTRLPDDWAGLDGIGKAYDVGFMHGWNRAVEAMWQEQQTANVGLDKDQD